MMSMADAIQLAGVKDDILHTADSICKRIESLAKESRMERVTFDTMKRSALSRAIIATETSLYDRQVLEKELMEWANKRAGHFSTAQRGDDDDHHHDGRGDKQYDDEDDDVIKKTNRGGVAAVVAFDDDDNEDDNEEIDDDPRDEWGTRLDKQREINLTKIRRRERKRLRLQQRQNRTDEFDEYDPYSAAARRLGEHEGEEALDPMFQLLGVKEQQITTATSALTSFTKRILSMYRAFLKMYSLEAGNSVVAVKLFEAETLRQLHLMETATHSAHTANAASANRAAAREKSSGVDVSMMKSQMSQMRAAISQANKAKLEQEDTIREQVSRIEILELAARELTRTVHQLRGEVRQHEEQEGRRHAAAKERRSVGGGAVASADANGASFSAHDEDSFMMQQRYAAGRTRNSSLMSLGSNDGDETETSSAARGGEGSSSPTSNAQHVPITRFIRVQSPADHRKCRMIARVLAYGLQKTKSELRQLKNRLSNVNSTPALADGSAATSSSAANIVPSSSRRFRTHAGAASLLLPEEIIDVGTQFDASEKCCYMIAADASTQTDTANSLDEADHMNASASGLLGLFGRSFRRRSTQAPQPPVGRGTHLRRSKTTAGAGAGADGTAAAAGSSAKGLNTFGNSNMPKTSAEMSSSEIDFVDASSAFFDNLADVLKEDAKSITRPRSLRQLVKSLDDFLNPSSSGFITIPLRKSITRVRDWALKEKVAQVQNAARSDVAAALASQYASVGVQRPLSGVVSTTKPKYVPAERERHVARPHAAADFRLKMSESAMSVLLPSADDSVTSDSMLMMMAGLRNPSPRRQQQQEQGQSQPQSPSKGQEQQVAYHRLHPTVDERMMQSYAAGAAKSREGPVAPREARPWSARSATAAKQIKHGVSGEKAPVSTSRFA